MESYIQLLEPIDLKNHFLYNKYLRNNWSNLFVPTIWWTLIYLLGMPWEQQVNKYYNFPTFCWQFINGNAAPHLWYNTMMLQFIILMPLFWAISRYVGTNIKRGIIIGNRYVYPLFHLALVLRHLCLSWHPSKRLVFTG